MAMSALSLSKIKFYCPRHFDYAHVRRIWLHWCLPSGLDRQHIMMHICILVLIHLFGVHVCVSVCVCVCVCCTRRWTVIKVTIMIDCTLWLSSSIVFSSVTGHTCIDFINRETWPLRVLYIRVYFIRINDEIVIAVR